VPCLLPPDRLQNLQLYIVSAAVVEGSIRTCSTGQLLSRVIFDHYVQTGIVIPVLISSAEFNRNAFERWRWSANVLRSCIWRWPRTFRGFTVPLRWRWQWRCGWRFRLRLAVCAYSGGVRRPEVVVVRDHRSNQTDDRDHNPRPPSAVTILRVICHDQEFAMRSGLTSRITSGALSDQAGAPSGACDVRRRVRAPQRLLRRPPAIRHDARRLATA
jgi:hypothetical protein